MARLLFIKVDINISDRVTSFGSPGCSHCWLVIADSMEKMAVLVLDGWMRSIEFTVSQSSTMSTLPAINWKPYCLCQTSKLNTFKHQKTKNLSLLRDLTQWDDICGLPTCISVTIDQQNDGSVVVLVVVVVVTLFLTVQIHRKKMLLYMYNIRLPVATRDAIVHRAGGQGSVTQPFLDLTRLSKYHKTCRSYCCSSHLKRTRQKQDNIPDSGPKNSGHHWHLR